MYFFDIGHPCYDQLTPVKAGYPLTSITLPYRGLKFTAHRGQVFFKLTADQVLVFFYWIVGSCLTCPEQGRIVRKLVNANPGLNVNQIITFSSFLMFLLLCFVYMVIIELKTEGQTIYRLLNSNQNSTFSWVSLIGF